ncbi:DENN domain-containing protein 1B isoform X2 [Bombina bombina]|uniref:DENN domain-containing protein 1B isoform X2 n=1 Tax=Bombina bombina TaxID=8345 RepID=UPI00235AE217|nr:DENN domain-containing protein 1B isoform X2 [Bombina bombina]
MGSRIKENPERIFEGFFEVLRPASLDEDPVLKGQFPTQFDDQESVTTLTKFCFPFDVERWENSAVQHFSFTLTDLQGNQSFGFCRLSIHSKCCICILSSLPWFELFYKLLNNIAEYLVKAQLSYFIVPDPYQLPSIPENRNLTEFMVAVNVETMLQLYSSLLFERRILITSSKLSTLTACVHASAALLYPMYWQHIYIPTLPPHLLDYCSAPMPFLIGVHNSLMERLNTNSLEDVVIINVDTNTFEDPFQDLQNLPSHVVSLLKIRLKKQSALMGDSVSRAFLGAQALLFGGYRDALICTPGEPISFCQETFLDNKCSEMKQFLQSAVHLQLFTQFIDFRLEKLNAGAGFTDIFEHEITSCGLAGNSRSYQLWLENLKKSGGSIIHSVKSRTHPTVKNMLKYAKGQAKTGLQGMRSRINKKEIRKLQRGGSLKEDGGPTQSHERLQNRLPITQHFGQSRPRRPGKKYIEVDNWGSSRCPPEKEKEGIDSVLNEEDEFPPLEKGDMDLLEDIFETLNTRAPGEQHKLYGTHSLDFFNLDDSQYFTRFQPINAPSDENLCLSQPRDSTLWYLEEAEEEDQEDEAFDYTSMSPTSLTPEVASLSSEVATPASEVTSQTEEVISSTTEDISNIQVSAQTPPNVPLLSTRSDVNTLTLPPVEEECETRTNFVIREENTTREESPDQQKRVMKEMCDQFESCRDNSPHASGPNVHTAISQTRSLDPRMMWTGTRRDTSQSVRRLGDQWQNNAFQATIQNHSTKKCCTWTNSATTPSTETHSNPNPSSSIGSIRQTTEGINSQCLPKVSELKKRFEA